METNEDDSISRRGSMMSRIFMLLFLGALFWILRFFITWNVGVVIASDFSDLDNTFFSIVPLVLCFAFIAYMIAIVYFRNSTRKSLNLDAILLLLTLVVFDKIVLILSLFASYRFYGAAISQNQVTAWLGVIGIFIGLLVSYIKIYYRVRS